LAAKKNVYHCTRSGEEIVRWGWQDTLGTIQRRLENLESAFHRKGSAVPELHEIETVPCLSQDRSGTDMVATHSASADVNRVFVIPFRFAGQIFVRRISLICSATATNTSKVGLCLYVLDDPARVDQLAPRTKSLPSLRKLGSGKWIGTTGTTQVRLDEEHSKGTYLNTSKGLYYAAWTCDDVNGTVFCPNSGSGALDATKSFLASFKTNGTASPSDGFPGTLSITGDTDARAAPCVVGRSLSGLRVFGSFADDI
jgi:hypothetical protein